MIIKSWMEIDVYNTPGACVGKMGYMKNIHDWSEKISTENKTEVRTIMSTEEARGKLQAFAPLLLEVLQKDNRLLQQVGQVQEAEIVKE